MRKAKPLDSQQKDRLKILLNETKKKEDYQRVLCVWLRDEFSLTSAEVAKAIGITETSVKRINARYIKRGEEALIGKPRGGRHRENLTLKEEDDLLASFEETAYAGGMLVVTEIKQAYERSIGRKVPKSTVYRMLERHGWRKIAPRRKHPEQNEEEQNEFKKNYRK